MHQKQTKQTTAWCEDQPNKIFPIWCYAPQDKKSKCWIIVDASLKINHRFWHIYMHKCKPPLLTAFQLKKKIKPTTVCSDVFSFVAIQLYMNLNKQRRKKNRPKISIGFYDWAIKTTVAFCCLQTNSLSVFVLYSFYHFHIRLWFIPSIRLFQCQWNGIWNISIDTQTYHEDQPFNKQQQKSVNVYLGNSFFSLFVSTMMCNIYMKKLVICCNVNG